MQQVRETIGARQMLGSVTRQVGRPLGHGAIQVALLHQPVGELERAWPDEGEMLARQDHLADHEPPEERVEPFDDERRAEQVAEAASVLVFVVPTLPKGPFLLGEQVVPTPIQVGTQEIDNELAHLP